MKSHQNVQSLNGWNQALKIGHCQGSKNWASVNLAAIFLGNKRSFQIERLAPLCAAIMDLLPGLGSTY